MIKYNYLADFNAITFVPSSSGWNQIQHHIGNTNFSMLSFPNVKNLTDAPNFLKLDNNKVLNKGSKRKKFDLWPISQAKIMRLNNRILIINITPDF